MFINMSRAPKLSICWSVNPQTLQNQSASIRKQAKLQNIAAIKLIDLTKNILLKQNSNSATKGIVDKVQRVAKAVLPRSQKFPSAHPLLSHELKTMFHTHSNQENHVQGRATKMRFKTILKAIIVLANLGKSNPSSSISSMSSVMASKPISCSSSN